MSGENGMASASASGKMVSILKKPSASRSWPKMAASACSASLGAARKPSLKSAGSLRRRRSACSISLYGRKREDSQSSTASGWSSPSSSRLLAETVCPSPSARWPSGNSPPRNWCTLARKRWLSASTYASRSVRYLTTHCRLVNHRTSRSCHFAGLPSVSVAKASSMAVRSGRDGPLWVHASAGTSSRQKASSRLRPAIALSFSLAYWPLGNSCSITWFFLPTSIRFFAASSRSSQGSGFSNTAYPFPSLVPIFSHPPL
ncbi:hypothetical protein EDC01DRAFT_668078 [Geopyxis carbonaria]|nr:hypothetical protein EDC01DRAFT_668078 [Geopyxis carbonaria]